MKSTPLVVTGALLTLLAGAATAQIGSGRAPTQRDFDACNREAELNAGSAMPGAAGNAVPPTSPPSTLRLPSAAGATGDTGSLSGGSTLANGAVAGMRP
ncbi:MAG TPA: hypothetical protein VI172_10190, partial [Candidatus Dormibacteraeota bacterium]